MDNLYNNKRSSLREKILSNENSNEVHDAFLNHVRKTPKNRTILDIGNGYAC